MSKINFRKTRIFIFAIAAIILWAGMQNAMANTEEWTGIGNDYKWRTNGNWHGAFGAGANDDLVFGDRVCSIFGCVTTFRRELTNNDFPVNTSFNSITVFGTGYQFLGNQIILQNGISVGKVPSGGLRVSNPRFKFNIVLGDSQTWSVDSGTADFNGAVNLNNNVLTANVSVDDEMLFNFLINGRGQLKKTGDGTLCINGAANAFGQTTILDGVVRVDGSLGSINLVSGEVQGKGYTGSIDSSISSSAGGSISPGDGLDDSGVLHVSGIVDLDQNDVLKINLNGPTLGSQYDQLQVSNSNVRIIGPRLELSLGFVPTPGQQFTIVRQVGAGDVLGQFDQGNVIVENNQLFFISYLADRVILTAQGAVGP